MKQFLMKTIMLGAMLGLPMLGWACDGAGPSTHVGTLKSVDASGKTFTIIDAQTRKPIKFTANNEIIDGLKDANGSVMVNYEQVDGSSDLKAVGVTF